MNEQRDEDLSSLLRAPELSKLSSGHPLEKIRKNLVKNMIWGIIICILYVIIIINFRIWQVQVLIGLVLLFSCWTLYTAFREYKRMGPGVSAANPVLGEMKRHHQSILIWMKTQQRVALFIYPFAAAGGFILGGVLGSDKPVEVFLSKPIVPLALALAILILVPAAYYLARWMFDHSFGKHLKALKMNIEELEKEN